MIGDRLLDELVLPKRGSRHCIAPMVWGKNSQKEFAQGTMTQKKSNPRIKRTKLARMVTIS